MLLVLTDFYYNKITKQEARGMLSTLLVDVPPPYVPEAQVILDKILEEDVAEEDAQDVAQEVEIISQQEETPVVEEPSVQPDIVPEPVEEPELPTSKEVVSAEEPIEAVEEIQYEEIQTPQEM